jgi:putative sterol carrier protein
MATHEEIRAALEAFAQRFAAEPRLRQMTQGWDRTIELRATDLPSVHALEVRGGELRLLDRPAGQAQIVVEAPSDLLADVFRGAVSPTEPYMSGDLVVRASEQDVMRLDVITLMVWGE